MNYEKSIQKINCSRNEFNNFAFSCVHWCLGLCGFWGNGHEIVDGITSYIACVATDPDKYQSNATSATPGYTNLSYVNWTKDGYPKARGYDQNDPLIAFATVGGGNGTTGLCDYFYPNSDTKFVYRGGGASTNSGLFNFNCYHYASVAQGGLTCRLLKQIK